jgi:hypothetical protein
MAAKFFADQHARSVWVIEDTTNPTYSQYLAREFLQAAYEESPELKVILWSNNLNLPPYSVDKLGIDWVFFTGGWTNALVLVRQLKALPGKNKPKVLLSEASADRQSVQPGLDAAGKKKSGSELIDIHRKAAGRVTAIEFVVPLNRDAVRHSPASWHPD